MRIERSVRVPRADLTPVHELLGALQAEWADLVFTVDGAVVNPLTGDADDTLTLVEGEHRTPGSVYRIVTGDGDHHRMTLTCDDGRRFACSVADEAETWHLDIDVTHTAPASVSLSGSAEAARLVADREPGRVLRHAVGRGEGRAVLDLAALDVGGSLLEVNGDVPRVRGLGHAHVAVVDTAWVTDVCLEADGRGLGRLVLPMAARHFQREVERHLAALLEGLEAGALNDQLEQTRREVEEAGGPRPLVREVLWADRGRRGDRPSWPPTGGDAGSAGQQPGRGP